MSSYLPRRPLQANGSGAVTREPFASRAGAFRLTRLLVLHLGELRVHHVAVVLLAGLGALLRRRAFRAARAAGLRLRLRLRVGVHLLAELLRRLRERLRLRVERGLVLGLE